MKRLLKYTLAALAAILVLPTAFLCGLYLTADMEQPAVTIDTAAYRVTDPGGYAVCHGSFLRRNPPGRWELYTAGSPEESGAAAGALTAGLMHYQEQVFVDRIREFIPSEGYLKFLGGMIRIFNRNLGRHVPEEYRSEIYARSLYCSHDFDAIGTPYERQLNYHAAHDIGVVLLQLLRRTVAVGRLQEDVQFQGCGPRSLHGHGVVRPSVIRRDAVDAGDDGYPCRTGIGDEFEQLTLIRIAEVTFEVFTRIAHALRRIVQRGGMTDDLLLEDGFQDDSARAVRYALSDIGHSRRIGRTADHDGTRKVESEVFCFHITELH